MGEEYKDSINRMVNRSQCIKLPESVKRKNAIRLVNHKIPHSKIISASENLVVQQVQVPVMDRCDVLVCGGGPAGLSAAIGAARAGADTILMDRWGCFGGTITTVGIEHIGWYRYEGTDDCEGIGREMERVAERMGASHKWPFNDSPCLDADMFKVIADNLIKEAGVRPYLHCYVADVVMENDTITGVITESKSGRKAILAKRVIDCTGDADVAYLSGVPYTTLPMEDSLGATTVFSVANVDKKKFEEHVAKNTKTYEDWNTDSWRQTTAEKENDLKSPYLAEEFSEQQANLEDKNGEIQGSWASLTDAGEATGLNLVHQKNVDATNVADLTRAEINGRQNVGAALEGLQKNLPGFEKAKLRNFGMTLGVRDSRKIVAKYNLTAQDVCEEGRFHDSIGVFPEFVDGYAVLLLPTTGRYWQVPYRALVPENISNLLVAGRCIGGDMVSHASSRNMMCCTVTGQGAGIAAAVSIRLGQTTDTVDIAEVQAELTRQGVRIGHEMPSPKL